MEKFKKIFVGGIILSTILTMCVVTVPKAGAAASAGDLIKMSGLSSVYYLAADGKRYVFPNEQTYFSWYSDFSGVVTIPQSELESYPLGANVTIRPGTKLVKITTDPKVYAVQPNGKLIWVPSEAVASTLFGSLWAKRIVDAPDAFFTNYTVMTGQLTASAYPIGSLVKWADSSSVYYIDATGAARKIANEAAFNANRFKWADLINAPTSVVIPTLGSEISGAESALTDTSSGAGGSIGAGTGLTVALSSATAASATVITDIDTTDGNGQANVPFLTVNFTASPDGDVAVKNIRFKRNGISADSDMDNLFLYDGATRLTDGSSVSSTYTTFNNAAGLFTVAKGTTKSITVKGDLSYAALAGKTIGFSLVAATDVVTNGAVVSGSFPMSGNLMSTANTDDLGKLTFSGYSDKPAAASTSINAGDNQQVFSLVLTSTNQDLSVERLKFTAVGSIQLTDLQNFKMFYAGSQVGPTVQMTTGNLIDFDMSAAPLAITKGQAKTLTLRADIKDGSTRNFYISIQNQNDVIVKDLGYNVYIEPYAVGTFAVIKPDDGTYLIASGSLSIVRATASPTGSVAVDATNVTLGIFDFTAAGEDIKVKELVASSTVNAATTALGGIDNGKIYLDDVQVGTTKDLTNGTAVTFTFGSTMIIKAGTTSKVKIVGDVKKTSGASYTGGQTLTVAIGTGSANAQRMTSLGTFDSPSSDVTGNALTITIAGLAVYKYSGYGNQTITAGTNTARMGSMVLAAGSAEGVAVSSITVTLAGSESSTVTNMYLKDAVSGAQLGSTIVTPTDSNNYSVSFSLNASQSKVIDIYANVKPSSVAGAVAWAADITADGSGLSTSKAVTATSQTLQSITIGTGTLTVTGGSQPDAAILLAGSTGNSVAQYTFSSTNEAFVIDKLNIKVGNGFSTSTAAVSIKYLDSAGTQQTAQSVFVTGDEAAATATFTGLSVYVPKNASANVDVYVDLTSISSGAVSGATGSFSLDYNEGFNAVGDSGAVKTTPTSSTADITGSDFYVRKSKPTFAKQTLTGSPSSSSALYRFTVVADAAGNIDIKQLGFTFVTSECSVTDTYLYDPNTSTILTDTLVVPVWATSLANAKLIVGTINDDVLTIGTTAKTYEVRGTVTGYSSTAGDTISVQFKQDTSATSTNKAIISGANESATYVAHTYNIWSDRSASSHTTNTSDWTNGFLLKDMTGVQSF